MKTLLLDATTVGAGGRHDPLSSMHLNLSCLDVALIN